MGVFSNLFCISLIFDIYIAPFSHAAGPYTIIAYPDLPSDYLDFKFEFDSQQGAGADPFFEKIKKSKQAIVDDCEGLRDASLYKVDPRHEHEEHAQMKRYPQKLTGRHQGGDLQRERKALKYESKIAKVGISDDHKINLFRCNNFVKNKYFYVSYGFNDDFMYFFENPKPAASKDEEGEIEFVGRIEPKPLLDEAFRKLRDI